MAYLLSFCIPTYNFGRFIGETLRAIIDQAVDQANDRIQIVIVDGGSTDNTAAIVTETARTFAHIKFIQRERNVGVDRDILESVAQADAPFCWLFSSDDVPVPGAVKKVLDAIAEGGWDVLLTGMASCDVHLRRMSSHPILDLAAPRTFDWSDTSERHAYFAAARTTTAFFSFISDIIVRREVWMSAPTDEQFLGSCWIIAAKLFGQGARGMNVRFNPDEYLLKRGDNDSFASRGLVRRTELSLRGFRAVVARYFGPDSFESRQVSRTLRNEYTLAALVSYKGRLHREGSSEQQAALLELVDLHYADPGMSNRGARILYRLLPGWICSTMLAIFHAARKKGATA